LELVGQLVGDERILFGSLGHWLFLICVDLKSRRLAAKSRWLLKLMLVMRVIVMMLVILAVLMRMVVVMFMTMRMIVLAMMQALPRPRSARVFAEHQRFDGDRHGIGRHADAAEIDVIEIPQHHAVDDQKIAANVALVAKEMPQRVRHVAIQHNVER